jgi:spore coat polysaccharide biosynthesis predicted glycosyltransferase SpsG
LKEGDAVVLDGYHLDEVLENELKSRGFKVATIDDNAERRFSADWVLNGNVHALRLRYRTAKHTRRALGPKYFIFANELLSARKPRKFPVRVKKILVTMGGADPDNETEKVLRAIALLKDPELEVTVVSGASNLHHHQIMRYAKSLPCRCTVMRSTNKMGELMARADVGISSAGRVAAEMALLGLPSLKIVLAENQLGLVKELHRKGAAINLGWRSRLASKQIAARLCALMDDVALRKKMSDKGRRLFDARGTERVAKILEQLVR